MIKRTSSFQSTGGKLYLVPTPIGNLDDMTMRAIKVLQEVDLIAAEDTRHTQMLLNHFDIHTPSISFHEHNTAERIPQLVAKLQAGQTITIPTASPAASLYVCGDSSSSTTRTKCRVNRVDCLWLDAAAILLLWFLRS